MDRRTTTWIGAGCLVLLLLLAIPVGLAIWAFQNVDLGNITNPPRQEEQSRPLPEQGSRPSQDDQPGDRQTVPQTGSEQNDSTRGPVEIGNLGVAPSQIPESLADLYDEVNPGAVAIAVEVNQGGQVGQGAGSGFIITDTGYIATNDHVVEGAQQVYVTFFNQLTLPAEVVGTDPNSDLAIIKVEALPEDTRPIALGDSDAVRVGDPVVAIGNPFGLGTSMSYGIVSAVGRVIPSLTDYTIPQAIQTDAAINPGNSGGPLINMNGEVIGINAQIRTGSEGGGNIGIGFAIPVNILKQVYESLIQDGTYTWPYLGVRGGTMSPAVAEQVGVDTSLRGAYLAEITSGGPASEAGLQVGDVVVQADDRQILSFDDLLTYIAFKRPGDQVNLTVVRNGEQTQVTVTLKERPQTQLGE